jgi:hypothetical protein
MARATRSAARPEIDEQEISRRVAFLRRFKETLIRQRERFQAYLDLLERGGDTSEAPEEVLEFHVTLEEAVVRDIAVFERTLKPLEAMYEAQHTDDDTDIPQIRAALSKTREDLLHRTRLNREKLKGQIESITRSRTPVLITRHTDYKRGKPTADSATLVDLHA